eukprot:TRINITY_DN1434_c0_g1_i5.p1 TRINITY_DN1434_c0_g1~~TRINITY_DN1434_c0_g1_i5.p1  ORF type:complete len:107 (-),score=23.58 TRINITY_DN1434_c0_g1_i5:211-531(-)
MSFLFVFFFFFQAEDGIRDLVRSRGLGDVYKRQLWWTPKLPSLSQHQPQLPNQHRLPLLPRPQLQLLLLQLPLPLLPLLLHLHQSKRTTDVALSPKYALLDQSPTL